MWEYKEKNWDSNENIRHLKSPEKIVGKVWRFGEFTINSEIELILCFYFYIALKI